MSTLHFERGRLYQVQGKVTGVTTQSAGGVRVNLVPKEGGANSMFMARRGAAARGQARRHLPGSEGSARKLLSHR